MSVVACTRAARSPDQSLPANLGCRMLTFTELPVLLGTAWLAPQGLGTARVVLTSLVDRIRTAGALGAM